MSDEIETFNKHMVCVGGDGVCMMLPPRGSMTKEDALLLAAWLVTLTFPKEGEFEKVLAAVRST